MAKYYISSGEFQKIILADSPKEAAEKSLNCTSGEMLDCFVNVSERGFRPHKNEHGSVNTEDVPEWSFKLSDMINVIGNDNLEQGDENEGS